MNIEQKAKHYDEAIVRAKAMIKVAANQDEAIGFANTIFPELTELEDEKIRKALIEYFNAYPKDYFGELKKSYIIAWLENKGEQKSIIEMKSPEESLGISSKEYDEIINDCLYGESTPAEGVKKQSTEHQNEEELSDFEAALFSAFSDGWQQYLNGEEVDVVQWAREHSTELLEAAKEELKKQSEQKPTVWSEKDKEIIKRIASFMWKNRKGDTDEIFQQEQDVKWLNLLIGENS